jgi:pantetheine-phosphate adenylyltransferase
LKGELKTVEIAIYPGSFDPVTKGHLDIIKRTSKIVGHLIVTVLENPRKQAMFSIEERLEMLKRVTAAYENVQVDYFQGLLIDYAKQRNISIMVKGLRAISDFEFEFQMALVNRKLNPDIETLFMMTNSKYSYLSSSIVKEIASFGGDISDLVPSEVYDTIIAKYR